MKRIKFEVLSPQKVSNVFNFKVSAIRGTNIRLLPTAEVEFRE